MPRPWIFFDAAGTLFAVRGSIGGQYALAARRFGAVCDADKLERAFCSLFPAASSMALPDKYHGQAAGRAAGRSKKTGIPLREREFQWWKNVVREVCRQAGLVLPFDAYFESLFQNFATSRCWDLYPETLATLKLLTLQGRSLGIISNFDSRLHALVKDLGLHPWISQVIHSSAVGAAKPDPKIFLEACARVKVKPKQAWHVGDSLREDFEAARSAGLNAVLVDRNGRNPEFSGPKVKRLSQLFPLL
ncbi:MAG TPA: HAD-IA family hydrolase [Acidobacteriota bacterium]|jgi:putative hydrolase of the HAD superfamily